MKIKLVGIDPALRNFGFCKATLDLDTMKLNVDELVLVHTESQAGKQVRKNSDDLRCARQLYEGLVRACEGAAFAIAEIPTGTQSARGAFSNGACLGLLASCPVPLIQVQPLEVKLATVGKKTASKDEMIAWAMTQHPTANWLLRKLKGQMVPIDANEHLADATAAVYAGLLSDQFKQAIALTRSFAA